MIATHTDIHRIILRVRYIAGIDIDHFHHPVGIRASGGDIEFGRDRTSQGDILL